MKSPKQLLRFLCPLLNRMRTRWDNLRLSEGSIPNKSKVKINASWELTAIPYRKRYFWVDDFPWFSRLVGYVSSLEGYDISELTNQKKSTGTEFRSRSVPDFHFHGVQSACRYGRHGRFRRLTWPFDPNPSHKGWEWWVPTIFYLKIWNHRTEPTIRKWMFRMQDICVKHSSTIFLDMLMLVPFLWQTVKNTNRNFL